MGMLEGTGMEKRRYIRVPSHFPVKYYSAEDPSAGRTPYESMSDNISVGGVMFFAEKRFELNELLRIEFKIEEASRSIQMSVLGRVVWVDEIENGILYNTGVEFQNLTRQQKEDLGRFVEETLKEKRELESKKKKYS